MLVWKLPKWLLVLCLAFLVLGGLFGLSWIVFRFDLPFLHSGDTFVIRLLFFCYWVIFGIFIFGFDLADKDLKGR